MISKELGAFAAGVLVGVAIDCMARMGMGEKIALALEEKAAELKKGVAKASKHAKEAVEDAVGEAR